MLTLGYFPFCIKEVDQEPDPRSVYPSGFSLENLMDIFWNFKEVSLNLQFKAGDATYNAFLKPYLNSPNACGGGWVVQAAVQDENTNFEDARIELFSRFPGGDVPAPPGSEGYSVIKYKNKYYPGLYAEGINPDSTEPEFGWPWQFGNDIPLYKVKFIRNNILLGTIPLQVFNTADPQPDGIITAKSTYYF